MSWWLSDAEKLHSSTTAVRWRKGNRERERRRKRREKSKLWPRSLKRSDVVATSATTDLTELPSMTPLNCSIDSFTEQFMCRVIAKTIASCATRLTHYL